MFFDLKLSGPLKNFKTKRRFLFRPRLIHICKKTESKSRWTVPLSRGLLLRRRLETTCSLRLVQFILQFTLPSWALHGQSKFFESQPLCSEQPSCLQSVSRWCSSQPAVYIRPPCPTKPVVYELSSFSNAAICKFAVQWVPYS